MSWCSVFCTCVSVFVCLDDCDHNPCRSGWTGRDFVWGVVSQGPNEPCVRWRPRSFHLKWHLGSHVTDTRKVKVTLCAIHNHVAWFVCNVPNWSLSLYLFLDVLLWWPEVSEIVLGTFDFDTWWHGAHPHSCLVAIIGIVVDCCCVISGCGRYRCGCGNWMAAFSTSHQWPCGLCYHYCSHLLTSWLTVWFQAVADAGATVALSWQPSVLHQSPVAVWHD